jgi:hypothetical protein
VNLPIVILANTGVAMRVYETEHFKELVEEYGLREHVNQQNLRIQAQPQRFEVSALFSKHRSVGPNYLKDRKDYFRLIGNIKNVPGGAVFVWLNIFQRSDSTYSDFKKLPITTIEKDFDQQQLELWNRDQDVIDVETARPDPLPDELHPWLYSPLNQALVTSSDGQELMVYETNYWVRNILEVGRNDLSSFRRTVEEIVNLCEADREFGSSQEPTIHFANPDGSGAISFRKMDASSILLLAPLRNGKNFKNSDIPEIDSHEWKKSARRAYPAYITLDADMWIDVQDERRSNLALSPEEESLLERLTGKGVEKSLFPLFINGSAGSGKSTMLAYVFAGLCRTKQELSIGAQPGRPIFLTYSEKLVDEARQMTGRILKNNVTLQTDLNFDIDPLFQSWRRYLVQLLPYDQRSNYDERFRIDFHQFKLSYNGGQDRLRPLKQRSSISAEQAWYVIRSLIKGSAPIGKTELTPDDYSELSRQDRVVSEDTFQLVWNSIYKSWYQPSLRDDKLWDDQDLVGQALTIGRFDEQEEDVVALVIDEAQDFTRRELILVARSSAFRKYDIPQGAPVALPIVFAGDPMQSLSPTGFRWDAVKATIYEELESVCDNAAAPNFEHLTNNYRSTPKIVALANAIQIMRAVDFDLPKSRLQVPWVSDSDAEAAGIAPQKFLIGTANLSESHFMEYARQTIIVVPCEEGGELHYVKNDPILSRMYPDASEEQPAGNIFSAAGVKGLEHERVILYKFGEWAPVESSKTSEGELRDLEAEYYFNKLYVAATRATKYLIIVDSPDGDDRLWKRLSFDAIQNLKKALSPEDAQSFGIAHSPGDTSQVLAIAAGVDEAISQIADETLLRETNPLQTADKIREHAIETRNPQSLRKAKSWYRQLGYSEQERLCEAFALRFEGKREEAAEEFVAANNFGEAFNSFWAAGAWDKLTTHYPEVITAVDPSPLDIRVIAFMSTISRSDDSFFELIHELQLSSDEDRLPRPMQEQWESIVEEIRNYVSSANFQTNEQKYGLVAEILLQLHRGGFAGCASLAADLFMKSGQVSVAERIWIQNNLQIPANHARRLAAEAGSPAGFKYLLAAQLYDDVILIWKNTGSATDAAWVEPVQTALAATGNISGEIELLLATSRLTNASTLLLGNIQNVSQLEDMVLPITEAYGSKGDISSGRQFIDRANDRARRISYNQTRTKLIQSAVEGAVERKWSPLPEQQRVALVELLSETYNYKPSRDGIRDKDVLPYKESDRKQLSLLYWGAAFELAGDYLNAVDVYEKLLNSQNQAIRRQSRLRWASSLRNIGKHTDQKYSIRIREWKIPMNNLPIVPVLDPSVRLTSQTTIGKTSGERDSLSWSLQKEGTVLQVTIADDDVMEAARFDVQSMTKINGTPGVDSELDSDGNLEISVADWHIVLSKDKDKLTHTDPYGTAIEEPLAVVPQPGALTPSRSGSGQPRNQGRVTRTEKSKAVIAADLRDEIGLTVAEFDRLCQRSGVPKKGANSRVSEAEVKRIREQLEKEVKKRNR